MIGPNALRPTARIRSIDDAIDDIIRRRLSHRESTAVECALWLCNTFGIRTLIAAMRVRRLAAEVDAPHQEGTTI